METNIISGTRGLAIPVPQVASDFSPSFSLDLDAKTSLPPKSMKNPFLRPFPIPVK